MDDKRVTRSAKDTKKDEDKESTAVNQVNMEAIAAMHEELRAAISTDFKSAISSLESKLDTIQAKVDDHDKRVISLENHANEASDQIRALEASCISMAEAIAKLQAKVLDLEGRSRRNNIRIFGLPEAIESGSRPTDFFAELLVEVLGEKVLTSAPELDRAHRALKRGTRDKPRSVVMCFHKFQTRDLVVREARSLRGTLQYRGTPIQIFEDYSPEVLDMRSEYRDVMKDLYNLNLKPSLLYPAKLFVTLDKNADRTRLYSVKEAEDLVSKHRRAQPFNPSQNNVEEDTA